MICDQNYEGITAIDPPSKLDDPEILCLRPEDIDHKGPLPGRPPIEETSGRSSWAGLPLHPQHAWHSLSAGRCPDYPRRSTRPPFPARCAKQQGNRTTLPAAQRQGLEVVHGLFPLRQAEKRKCWTSRQSNRRNAEVPTSARVWRRTRSRIAIRSCRLLPRRRCHLEAWPTLSF